MTLYITPSRPCSYLPDRDATNLLADPRVRIDTRAYSELVERGFRRSGSYVYRPHCQSCQACVPVRIPVERFAPRRIQRRTWQRNRDLVAHRAPAVLREEQFRLYQRYVTRRHPGGGMDNPTPEDYVQFLTSPSIDTGFYEFRLDSRLVAVSVLDNLTRGLSAVYTFYDPDLPARSLGVYAVLWAVDEARRRNLPYLYLGYWIKDCRKMGYKDQYHPLEVYREGRWTLLSPEQPLFC